MGFQAPSPNSTQRKPQRAAPKTAPQALPARAPAPSHDFPSVYDPWEEGARPAAGVAAAVLDPRLERLIELACAELGCPPEEQEHLKARALGERELVESFCQRIFDERVRPRREKPDPLARPPGSLPVAFWLEGQAGRCVVEAPAGTPLDAYAGGRLELYHPSSTPFAARFAALIQAEALGHEAAPERAAPKEPSQDPAASEEAA